MTLERLTTEQTNEIIRRISEKQSSRPWDAVYRSWEIRRRLLEAWERRIQQLTEY